PGVAPGGVVRPAAGPPVPGQVAGRGSDGRSTAGHGAVAAGQPAAGPASARPTGQGDQRPDPQQRQPRPVQFEDPNDLDVPDFLK
ncbi:MAG TPA: hypothetical protein VGP51_00040, partial [Nocardioidaceae bacterium]|nr:hypothetical protein [Nocardioidaceae bacterium]